MPQDAGQHSTDVHDQRLKCLLCIFEAIYQMYALLFFLSDYDSRTASEQDKIITNFTLK